MAGTQRPMKKRIVYSSAASLARTSISWRPATINLSMNNSGSAFGIALPSMILPLVAKHLSLNTLQSQASVRKCAHSFSIRLLCLTRIVWIVYEKGLDSIINIRLVHGEVVTEVEAKQPHLYFVLPKVEANAFKRDTRIWGHLAELCVGRRAMVQGSWCSTRDELDIPGIILCLPNASQPVYPP
jgi:hypothetical protein